MADVSIINVKERGFDWDESCGLILHCSWYTEYGTTAIPSQQDTEEQEKAVVNNGKELIAKFCSQCAQSEVSQWICFSRPQYIGDLTMLHTRTDIIFLHYEMDILVISTLKYNLHNSEAVRCLVPVIMRRPLLLRRFSFMIFVPRMDIPRLFVERVGVCVCYAE